MNIYNMKQPWLRGLLSQALVFVAQQQTRTTSTGLAISPARFRPRPAWPIARSTTMRRQEFLQLHLARDLATHSDFHCCRPRPAEPTMRSLTRRHKVRRQLLLAGDLATHSFWHAFHHTRQCWATCFLWLLWQYFLGTLETQWVKTLMQQGNWTI